MISLKDSHRVFISDETWRKIRGFLPVVRKVMGTTDFSEIDLIELAIWLGLDQMLTDVIPEDSSILVESFKHMNLENPEEVGKIIVDKLEKREFKSLSIKWRKEK
ncbi:MAG: hypothetical protein ACFFB2_17300 [Promethearchaeota archaeon]